MKTMRHSFHKNLTDPKRLDSSVKKKKKKTCHTINNHNYLYHYN